MSTTFGLPVPKISLEDNPYMERNGYWRESEEDETIMIIPIAFRSSGNIKFINPIAQLLDDSIEIIAMEDNSNQGIYTIGDIKKQIKKQITNQLS